MTAIRGGEGCDAIYDGLGLDFVVNDGVVQRAMRFYVTNSRAVSAGERIESANLIEHLIGEFVGCVVHETATETSGIAVANVGAYGNTGRGRVL